ncbi:MAG: LssY C-terminal domain-containing protein [Pirellulales bacterium]
MSAPVRSLLLHRHSARRRGALVAVLIATTAWTGRSWAEPPQPSPAAMIEGHPALARAPRHTTTSRGHQGDAVNVAFIGTDEELHRALAAAGWYAADPITLKTSVRIAADVVLRKPYPHAPVSDLFLWGRRQDAAFEQPVGNSPKQRHHVRFWRSADVDGNGEPLWLGAATFDERVEISRTTGGITHRISPAIDKERNKLLTDAMRSNALDGFYWVDRFHRQPDGTNGGGDPYFTDRRLAVGVIAIR